MKTTIFTILSFIKVGGIIYFFAMALMILFRKSPPDFKRKVFIQFLSMFGVLIGITILEFGIAYLLTRRE